MAPHQTSLASRHPPRAVLAGIGFMLLGIFLFSVNDVLGKWLVATYAVGQLLLIRSLAALVVLVPLAWRGGVSAITAAPRPGLQLVRVVISTFEVALFYWAVMYLPLADTMTFYLAGPILVAALAPLLLGETLDGRRIAAIALGFVGVVIALRPSALTLTGPALIPIAGTILFALLMITTRKLRGTSDTVLVLGQNVGGLVFGIVAAPFAWAPLDLRDFALLSLLGIVAMFAHICVTRSLKLAPASVVTPYQYTLLVWAILFGYLVFGDVPQPWMLVGAAVIVAAGLLLLLAERKAAAEADKQPALVNP